MDNVATVGTAAVHGHAHAHAEPGFWRKYVFSVDHKVIGIQYALTALLFLLFGFILMALELLAPGVFMFWLGLAALLVGLMSFAINPSWQTQLLMFAVFAVAAVPAGRGR